MAGCGNLDDKCVVVSVTIGVYLRTGGQESARGDGEVRLIGGPGNVDVSRRIGRNRRSVARAGKLASVLSAEVGCELDGSGLVQLNHEAGFAVRSLFRNDRVDEIKVVGRGAAHDPEVSRGIEGSVEGRIDSVAHGIGCLLKRYGFGWIAAAEGGYVDRIGAVVSGTNDHGPVAL